MKKVLLLVILIGFLSCESKESHYKDIKINELTNIVDSLKEDNHQLQLQIWAQDELVYFQDTTITFLQNQLKQ